MAHILRARKELHRESLENKRLREVKWASDPRICHNRRWGTPQTTPPNEHMKSSVLPNLFIDSSSVRVSLWIKCQSWGSHDVILEQSLTHTWWTGTIFTLFMFVTCLLVSSQLFKHSQTSSSRRLPQIYNPRWTSNYTEISLVVKDGNNSWLNESLTCETSADFSSVQILWYEWPIRNKILQKWAWCVRHVVQQQTTTFPKNSTQVWVMKKMTTQTPSASLKLIITTCQMSPECIISTGLLNCCWAQHVHEKKNQQRNDHEQLMSEAHIMISAASPSSPTSSTNQFLFEKLLGKAGESQTVCYHSASNSYFYKLPAEWKDGFECRVCKEITLINTDFK